MTVYNAPLSEMHFVINELAGMASINALPGYEDASSDMVEAILDEAGKFGRDVIAPLNKSADEQGAVWKDKTVTTPDGFKEAYSQFVEGGWNSLVFDPEYGGQGLPWVLQTAVSEIWNSGSLAFALCPMLTQGAVELLQNHGSDEQKAIYLPKMISGEWSGTMNLTESSAGSDLGAARTKAVKQSDGTYRITGQKIFITHGEQDLSENIIHLVLARTPDAPEGSRGLSLFIAPKFLVNEDGSLGKRNDAYCISIEHKLGIHGSPTAVMSFGDDGEGAVGYLVGSEGKGLACMFTMMNNARLAVGLEGVAVAERAYQAALAYAKERVQSRVLGDDNPNPQAIINHPDVRRMLLSMKSHVEAGRALAYYTASLLDHAHANPDDDLKAAASNRVALLTPVVKAWCTDMGIDVANDGIQVHGGMGFIEESGAPQMLRDVRITAIYEGTNGIQANDLIGRKVARENGQSVKALIADIKTDLAGLSGDLAPLVTITNNAVTALEQATDWLITSFVSTPQLPATGAVHYLKLLGDVSGAWLLLKGADIAKSKLETGEGDPAFLKAKILSAKFFVQQQLVLANGLKEAFINGASAALEMTEDAF